MNALPQAASDEALIAQCARRASLGRSPGLTRDDMLQEGRLAIWLAAREGRIPDDPEHRSRYVRCRALGAMRDANRRDWRQQPIESCELGDNDVPDGASPEARLQMRQLIGLLMRRASPRVSRCVELLAEGCDDTEVAAAMRVSASRVSQLRKQARQLVAALW